MFVSRTALAHWVGFGTAAAVGLVLAAAPAVAAPYTGLVANNYGVGPLGEPTALAHVITEFSPDTYEIGPSIPLSGTPTSVAGSPDGTKAYVVDGCNAGC